jgi:hypothetical protein
MAWGAPYLYAMRQVMGRIEADTAIEAAFRAWYGVAPNCRIGMPPQKSAPAYPFIACDLAKGQWDKNEGDVVLSIVAGVNQSKDAALERSGIAIERLHEAAGLVLIALKPQPLAASTAETPSVIWQGKSQTMSDMGLQDPYYELETQVLLKMRAR